MRKKGKDIVTIYEDPITEERPEGEAELVKFLGFTGAIYNGRRLGRHMVRFVGDNLAVCRHLLEAKERT